MHVYMPPRFLLYIYIYTMQIIFSWIYILTFKHASASSAKYPQTFYVYGKYGFIQGIYLNSMHIIFICQYYAYHSHSYKVPIMTKVHFRTVLIIMAFTLVKKRLLCLYKDIFILQLWPVSLYENIMHERLLCLLQLKDKDLVNIQINLFCG